MKKWFRFFAGTPARFLSTLGVVLLLAITASVFPGMMQHALIRLWRELESVIGIVLLLAIVLIGFWMISGGGKKK